MGWETVKPGRHKTRKLGEVCSICICAKVKEEAIGSKSGHTSNMSIPLKVMDEHRLHVGTRVTWLIDQERKAIAIQLDKNGNCTISWDNQKTRKKFRLHVPKAIAVFLRDAWGVGYEDRSQSLHVKMELVNGVFEIRRTTNDQT